jgi:hypothetical protein
LMSHVSGIAPGTGDSLVCVGAFAARFVLVAIG